MSYYSALITAWNNASASSGATLPSGVTGSLLTGMTTAQKIAAVNAWTIANAQKAILPINSIINAITSTDMLALTSAQLQVMTLLLQAGGGTTVDASPGTTVRAVFQSIFAGKTTTINQLSALVSPYDNATALWVTAPSGGGLSSIVTQSDVDAAKVIS